MNILAYNIIRKMIENPLEVEYSRVGSGGSLYIKGKFVIYISVLRHSGFRFSYGNNLSNYDLKRILGVVEHCEAIKIRNL